jgi:hypothetical protein
MAQRHSRLPTLLAEAYQDRSDSSRWTRPPTPLSLDNDLQRKRRSIQRQSRHDSIRFLLTTIDPCPYALASTKCPRLESFGAQSPVFLICVQGNFWHRVDCAHSWGDCALGCAESLTPMSPLCNRNLVRNRWGRRTHVHTNGPFANGVRIHTNCVRIRKRCASKDVRG